MSHRNPTSNQAGFLLIEIILAVALFGMVALISVSALTYGKQSSIIASDSSRAAEIANEIIDAANNLAEGSYSNISPYANGATYYLDLSVNQWSFTQTPQTIDNVYSPTVVFSDGPNNSRQVTAIVTWPENLQRTGSVTATTYLTNWQSPTAMIQKSSIFALIQNHKMDVHG